MKFNQRLARALGYDLFSLRKQMTLDTHLRALLPALKVDTVIDVGANRGQYACMLRRIGFQGDIFSFEPVSTTFELLKRAAQSDPRWQPQHMALGEQSAQLEMQLSNASEFASLHAPSQFGNSQFSNKIAASATEIVEVRRLDAILPELLPQYAQRRIYLKLDTQGHDVPAFKGAARLLPYIQGIQSELSFSELYEGVSNYSEALNIFSEQGFVVTGLFPVSRDDVTHRLIEADCVMRRNPTLGSTQEAAS